MSIKKQQGASAKTIAFSVHLLTASGAFLAFLALVAASENQWTAMFFWLGLALFVDGIDGPIARRMQVKQVLPAWSGDMLDNIIDYVTYVLVPAFALYKSGILGAELSFFAAALVVVTSAVYYAYTGTKTKENFFKGFPVVWNMVVFSLFVIGPGEYISFAVVVISAVLTFVPLNFLHPVRVTRLRPLNLVIFLAWCVFGVAALLMDMKAQPWVRWGIGFTGVYLYFIGMIMQIAPSCGRRSTEMNRV